MKISRNFTVVKNNHVVLMTCLVFHIGYCGSLHVMIPTVTGILTPSPPPHPPRPERNPYIYIYIYINTVDSCLNSSVVRAFAHGAMGRRIDPSWSGPIELFLVPASAPRLV